MSKAKILVIDDDTMNLRMAQHILEKDYEVLCAKSGAEGLAILQTNVPDLILLDLHMPEMNGFEVLEKIHEMDAISEIPVIFLTEDSERKTEVEIFKAGAMDYVQKPFSVDVLTRRIGRILELYHYQHSLQQEVDKKTEALRESNRRVINMSTQIMRALVSAIDAKHPYTSGHSVRVAEYARELAIRMGKSEREIDEMYYVGMMHDVGKIGIPDYIINKPTKLTEEEYEIVKQHPVTGAEILDNIQEMPGISTGAHWHHEQYGGGGYPDGLVGEDIPEEARIVCVADAYDTMTSRRSYRDILPQNVVRAEIERGKGTQFDPVIADYMLAMIDEDTDYQMHE
jgi:putative two-component system response regulator